jgi:hypothetical protein
MSSRDSDLRRVAAAGSEGIAPEALVPQLSALNVVTTFMVTEARPEMGREGAALHELVANWHSLTSSVRAKIVDLLRSG